MDAFLRTHLDAIAAAGCFSLEVLTLTVLVRYLVLFVRANCSCSSAITSPALDPIDAFRPVRADGSSLRNRAVKSDEPRQGSTPMLLFGMSRCENPCGSSIEQIPANGKLLRRSRSARLELSDPASNLHRSMLDETENLLRDVGAELVFGLVAPVGADLERLEADLVDLLRLYGYATNPIRLSALLRKVPGLGFELKESPEVDRIKSYMDAGNALRERSNSESILAAWALLQIKKVRDATQPVLRRTAHILRSIKHPAEARALRAVYGPGFYLIALSASTAQKVKYLKQRGLTEPESHQVINRDAGEENDFGQHTREAFELADVFIRQEPEHRRTTAQLDRFLRVVFGAVDETPTSDEHAMFLAYASSLRSADLSRQVGAVLWKDRIGVVGAGCNDVPAPGGGLYWPGPADQRDHALGHDANERHKRAIADEVARHVIAALQLKPEQIPLVVKACGETRLLDITEFGRAVHAEMDALLSCGRAGVDTLGSTLFSTTFPCHNCAKHIVAAGVKRVVYIEPYEKSQALDLHDDAIVIDDHGETSPRADRDEERVRVATKVVFEPSWESGREGSSICSR